MPKEPLHPKDHAEEVALFRAELIGDLKHQTLDRGDLAEALRERAPACAAPAPSDDYLRRVAREEVQDSLSSLAEEAVFLRSITPELPLPNGSLYKNPMHLNPCSYFVWRQKLDPFKEDLSLLLFFTAEYRCSEGQRQPQRFQRALETARTLQTEMVFARIKMEGELSKRSRLNYDGHAASPAERFADLLASEVFARILRREPSRVRRRLLYLTNTAWLCRKPSLEALHPEEARIERQLSAEPHSELGVRQQELLSSAVRNALPCAADFEAEKKCGSVLTPAQR